MVGGRYIFGGLFTTLRKYYSEAGRLHTITKGEKKSRFGSSEEFLRFLFKLNINYTTAPKRRRETVEIKAAPKFLLGECLDIFCVVIESIKNSRVSKVCVCV